MVRSTPTDLFAILFSARFYERIVGPELAHHQSTFRKSAGYAFLWTAAGAAIALVLAFGFDRIGPDRPIDWWKVAACTGAGLGAWATWFALATPEDTWDVTERLDFRLRGPFFKALFFPGLVLGLMGAF